MNLLNSGKFCCRNFSSLTDLRFIWLIATSSGLCSCLYYLTISSENTNVMGKDKTADWQCLEWTLLMTISMGKNKVPDCPTLHMHDFPRTPTSHTLLMLSTVVLVSLSLSSLEEERTSIGFAYSWASDGAQIMDTVHHLLPYCNLEALSVKACCYFKCVLAADNQWINNFHNNAATPHPTQQPDSWLDG